MKEQIPQPAPLSRTLQGKTREANTASVAHVLQAYKNDIVQKMDEPSDNSMISLVNKRGENYESLDASNISLEEDLNIEENANLNEEIVNIDEEFAIMDDDNLNVDAAPAAPAASAPNPF